MSTARTTALRPGNADLARGDGGAMTPQDVARVLSDPIKINQLTLKSRLVMGPMAVSFATPDGAPSDETVAYFERRARGGVGMIIAGGIAATTREPPEMAGVSGLRFNVDTFIPELKRVADAVHAHGVPIIAEFVPSLGRMARPPGGGRIISASPKNVVAPEDRLPRGFVIPGGLNTRTPEEATIAEIEQLERQMIEAAERAHRAGWDGVEIAAHMSYFAASFLSPRTNWRTDQYGGSVENRARMLVNVVKGIRQRLRPDFIVGLRILSNDYMPDGQGAAGFAAIAKRVEAEGIDYVAPAPGCYETMDKSMSAVDGVLIDSGDARIFKDTMSVPVFLQGLHDPARAAGAIAGGYGDVVMLARQMLADPDYPRKAYEGRTGDIVRCDRDNQCLRRLMLGLEIRCSVNPTLGADSRKPGALPPAKRLVRVPKERLILKLTSSRWFMNLAMAAMKKRERPASPDRRSA